jgi:hypothetical protein
MVITTDRHCDAHRHDRAAQRFPRENRHARGYDYAWAGFMARFPSHLVVSGIPPVCGATLPDGPQTHDSQCRALGLLTFTSADGSALHGDHEPPLRDDERADHRAVCDPRRVQLLCAACHARKEASRGGASWRTPEDVWLDGDPFRPTSRS